MTASPTPREIELESKVAFLEHTVDTLNEVLIGQGRALEALEQRLARAEARLHATSAGETRVEDPLQERPPHY